MVSITFFHFEGIKNKWWALKQFGTAPKELMHIKGVKFAKLLGSGGKGGFSVLPNFSIYAILISWENEQDANNFLKTNPIYLNFVKHSFLQKEILLGSLAAHGFWDGQQPFNSTENKPNGQIAVITRAKIRLTKLLQFWAYVKPTSESLKNSEGLIFSIGIGELPWVQQATFSIWENKEAMANYAYKNKAHVEVIKKTREQRWYSEELFARFEILESVGKWNIDADVAPLHLPTM